MVYLEMHGYCPLNNPFMTAHYIIGVRRAQGLRRHRFENYWHKEMVDLQALPRAGDELYGLS